VAKGFAEGEAELEPGGGVFLVVVGLIGGEKTRSGFWWLMLREYGRSLRSRLELQERAAMAIR
jgi:hypothetical protein